MAPPAFVKEIVIARHHVRVPFEQKKLLDRNDAWSESLRKDPHRASNVPDTVIETVKDSYRVKRRKLSPISASPVEFTQGKSSARNGVPREVSVDIIEDRFGADGKPSKPVPDPGQQEAEDGDDDEQESCVSWTPSLEREPAGARAISAQPDSSLPASECISIHHLVPSPAKQTTFHHNFPSSNAPSETDMEYVEPGVLNQPLVAVNKGGKIAQQTPPSAQIPIIPCSFNEASSPAKQSISRRRLMKKIEMDVEDAKLESRRRPQQFVPQTMDVVATSSASIPSTSVIAHTSQDKESRGSRPVSQTSPKTREITTPGQPNLPPEQGAEEGDRKTPSASETPDTTLSDPVPQSLYERYKSVYSEYEGSIGDFVRACMHLQELQKNGWLPSYAYDDAIRAFLEDFIPQLSSLGASSSRTPQFIKLYNRQVEVLQYTQLVVTRHNLDGFLVANAGRVEAIKREVQALESRAKEERTKSSQVDRLSIMSPVQQSPVEASQEQSHVSIAKQTTPKLVGGTRDEITPPPPSTTKRRKLDAMLDGTKRSPIVVDDDIGQTDTSHVQEARNESLEKYVANMLPPQLSSTRKKPQSIYLGDLQQPPSSVPKQVRRSNSIRMSTSPASTAQSRYPNETPEERRMRKMKNLAKKMKREKELGSAPSSARSSFGSVHR